MENIIRGFKKLKLKIQIKQCNLMEKELNMMTDVLHKIILETIDKGDEVQTKRLQLERDEYVDDIISIIYKRSNLRRLLKEA